MKIRVVLPDAKETIVTISENQSGWTMHRINIPVYQKSDTKEIDLDEVVMWHKNNDPIKGGTALIKLTDIPQLIEQFIKSKLEVKE